MAISLKGMDRKWHNHSSIDILRKAHQVNDNNETMLQLLASIGNELEDINALLKRELRE